MIKILSIGDTYIKEGMHSVNSISYVGGITKSPMETFNYMIQNRPDIVVYATESGNIEGVTIYQRIRNMYAGKYVPIILLIYEEDEELYEDFYDDGITVGLQHDIEEEILFLHIQQLVTRCREMKRNILIFDEDPIVLNTYSLFLEGKYNTFTAKNTSEAVNHLMTGSMNAIVMDVKAEGSSQMLWRLIKDNEYWKEIPLIIQADMNNMQLMIEQIGSDATYYLVKPVAKETLLDHLDYIFNPESQIQLLHTNVGRKRILLVDKQGVNYYTVKNILAGHYDTVHDMPGVRAVSLLESEPIDGVILNLDNGLFCLNKIIDKAMLKNIPILLFTSNLEEIQESIDEKTRSLPCIQCILEYPVTRQELLDELELAI